MTDRQIPTLRQFEALKYVYFMELTYEQAGVRMGISKQAVFKLVERLGEIAPELRNLIDEIHKKSSTPVKFITLIENTSYDFDDTF
jgi:predicted DNA-binding protein (UPF0251 family)